MEAELIDGKASAALIREGIAEKARALHSVGIMPCLAVVLVGQNPASLSYVKGKESACAENGIEARDFRLEATVSQAELLKLIHTLNHDSTVHGILVQLPLPAHIDEDTVIEAIFPEKDVDGFHPINIGKLFLGKPSFYPCTPFGVIKLLQLRNIQTSGKHVVVIGRSNIVGKPMAALLLQKGPFADATVTVCHSKTPDLADHVRRADIIIAAIGKANFVSAAMVKPGAVVIDVGVNRVEDASKKSGFRLVGDVDFAAVRPLASYITPVPGGVGPMTITMLLYNTVEAAQRSQGKE
jgi:methylenetetrahydrofolate dehydrogenase (NADP+)/methenyltetrahydrofolate cyclohydrolase